MREHAAQIRIPPAEQILHQCNPHHSREFRKDCNYGLCKNYQRHGFHPKVQQSVRVAIYPKEDQAARHHHVCNNSQSSRIHLKVRRDRQWTKFENFRAKMRRSIIVSIKDFPGATLIQHLH